MRSNDLTKEQCAAIRGQAGSMVKYLARLKNRMDYKGFPADDPIKAAVVKTLAAAQELYTEGLSRSIGVTGSPEPKQPKLDPLFTRISKPKRHEAH